MITIIINAIKYIKYCLSLCQTKTKMRMPKPSKQMQKRSARTESKTYQLAKQNSWNNCEL